MRSYRRFIQTGLLVLSLLLLTLSLRPFRLTLFSLIPSSRGAEIITEVTVSKEKELQELRAQVAFLSWQLIDIKDKLLSLTTFRQQFPLENVPYIIPASILIKRDNSSNRCSFVINRGKQDGVKAGAVAVFGHTVVGRVIETGKNTSRLLHISDPQICIGVILHGIVAGQPVEYGEGICLGISGNSCRLRLVEKNYQKWQCPEVTIVTSGFKGQYPRGLIVGTIISPYSKKFHDKTTVKTAEQNAGLFWDLPVKIITLDQLNTVLVIK